MEMVEEKVFELVAWMLPKLVSPSSQPFTTVSGEKVSELDDLWDKEKSTSKPRFPKDGDTIELDLFSLTKLTEVSGYRMKTVEGDYYRLSQDCVTTIADNRKPKQQIVKLKYIARDWQVKGSRSTVILLE